MYYLVDIKKNKNCIFALFANGIRQTFWKDLRLGGWRSLEDAPGTGEAVTSRPISAAILDYLVAPAGRGGLGIDRAGRAHFSGKS